MIKFVLLAALFLQATLTLAEENSDEDFDSTKYHPNIDYVERPFRLEESDQAQNSLHRDTGNAGMRASSSGVSDNNHLFPPQTRSKRNSYYWPYARYSDLQNKRRLFVGKRPSAYHLALQPSELVQQDALAVDKRRMFVGKKDNADGEKRRMFVGKKDDINEGKRRMFVGKRELDNEMDLTEQEVEKRRMFVGKRADDWKRRMFVGKRKLEEVNGQLLEDLINDSAQLSPNKIVMAN